MGKKKDIVLFVVSFVLLAIIVIFYSDKDNFDNQWGQKTINQIEAQRKKFEDTTILP